MGNKTLQSNIHTHDFDNLTNYSLFVGGLDVTHDSLMQYSPLKTGYGRLFMVRTPTFLDTYIPDKFKKFKHILEYGNTAVQGINNISVDFESISGSYTGKSFEIPMNAKDDTTAITIKTYEFSGSPIREVIHSWVTGVVDLQSGLSHYHGVDLEVNQANHTAEFIYVQTDQSGKNIEYACMFANCFPKDVKIDQFNYEAGSHSLVPMDVEFTATKYESPQVNEIALMLLSKYNVLLSCLDFHSGITATEIQSLPELTLKNSVDKG